MKISFIQFLQSLTLTRRLILVVAVIVFITALVANLGAYTLIKGELEWLISLYTDTAPSENLTVLQSEQRLLTALLINTLVIALIGAFLSGIYMRRLVSSVWRLREAARRMAHGDLTTPIRVNTHTYDVGVLAKALEQSRTSLAATMSDLAQTRDWLQTLIQSITEGIISFNRDGIITFFSAGAETITEWKAEFALNQPLSSILRLPEGDFMAQLPPLGERRSLAILTRSGQPCQVTLTRAKQISEGENTIVLHDITEETSRRTLQAYFLANMSHEFRTPLSALRISIELLQENWRNLSFSEMDELITSIHLSTTTLQNLIDNLLESSKIEANYLELRRRPSDVNAILAEALRVMQPLFNRRQQPLSVVEPLSLPQINADPVRLVQVMVNVLSNASKYSPVKTPVDFIIEVSEDNRYIRFIVADRGPGIPAGQREGIFRRFVRLHTPPEQEFSLQHSSEYGSGLGLSVVKAIIEGHGGTVGVDQRTGGGSQFWFTLPVAGEVIPA
jgi:two-component system, OmpR family, phosphate regulon sensor histidine kinase PhoR